MHAFLDWSGTVCDDVATTLAATNRTLEHFGGKPVDLAEYRREFRIPVWPFYAARIPESRPAPDALEDAFRERLAAEPPPQIFAGFDELLATLSRPGDTVRIVSTLPAEAIEAVLAREGLRGRIAAVHGGIRDKRDFLPRLIAEEGLSPDDCLMAGDMPHDLEAARAARVRSIALAHGYSSRERLLAERPDETFENLQDFAAWLRRHLLLEGRNWPIATVGGLVFRPDGRAFFVRTAKWSNKWGTPGGKIDYGEAHVDAFVREIREETGIEALDARLVLVQDAIEEPEFVRPRHFLLLNLVARCDEAGTILNHESLEGGWFDLGEASALDLNRPTRRLVEHLLAHREATPPSVSAAKENPR